MALRLIAILSVLGIALRPEATLGMGFRLGKPETFREKASLALLILSGTLHNTPGMTEPDPDKTECHIRTIFRQHPALKNSNVLLIPQCVPIDSRKHPPIYLLLADVWRGQIDIFVGIKLQSEKSLGYFKGALALDPKKKAAALGYFFNYLDHADPEVSGDACLEFDKAEYKDIRGMAGTLPADKILAWMRDPKTPAWQIGVYALLLGHCGTSQHAEHVSGILKELRNRDPHSIYADRVLIGYTLLEPNKGMRLIREIFSGPTDVKADSSFRLRYAALRAVRFFWETRPDVVKQKDLIDALCLLLPQTDIADLAIEDLRRSKVWSVADRIFDLNNKKTHNLPMIRSAVLRYALCCPITQSGAAAFVEAERKRDKEYVEDTAEMLKLETGGADK
jgi:hypothetical protein